MKTFDSHHVATYNSLFQVAKEELAKGGRYYHNVEHTQQVLQACRFILSTTEIPKALWMAAVWHDVIYIPGFESNEEASACHLRWVLKKLGYLVPGNPFGEAIDQASNLIRITQIGNHQHPAFKSDDPLSYVLLDADLVGFAETEYDIFATRQINIIHELGLTYDKITRNLSASFLKQFLDKSFIYHTDYGREHWEGKARKNITRWVNEKF
jgi:predicted metal-dependent HD superfamily phosphohydrolase